MYVHYYERELMNEGDNPPVGIVLCSDKSESVVKYTLPENETHNPAVPCTALIACKELSDYNHTNGNFLIIKIWQYYTVTLIYFIRVLYIICFHYLIKIIKRMVLFPHNLA